MTETSTLLYRYLLGCDCWPLFGKQNLRGNLQDALKCLWGSSVSHVSRTGLQFCHRQFEDDSNVCDKFSLKAVIESSQICQIHLKPSTYSSLHIF